MKHVWNAGKRKLFALLLIAAFLSCPGNVSADEEDVKTQDAIAEAKKGIAKIFSGFTDKEGNYWNMKSGSGFLISNAEGETYIVTNSSVIQNSKEEKQEYCKSNEIDAGDWDTADTIRIAVSGDVTAEASVLTKSEELDFCILSTPNVINEKIPLKLGNSTDLVTGDVVYTLGFPEQAEGLEFSPADVEIYQGTIQDAASGQSGVTYLQHSAVVSGGNSGGPVLDEAGYVVGINCFSYADEGTGRYYSLPADELMKILDNFAIDYGSEKKDRFWQDFRALYEECVFLNESGDYKNDSLLPLKETLAEAEKLMEEKQPDMERAELLHQNLTDAKGQAVPKTEKILIVIYVFAGLICLLLIRLIWILVFLNREKKRESSEKDAGSEDVKPEKGQAEEREQTGEPKDIAKTVQDLNEDQEKTVGLSAYQRREHFAPDAKDDFFHRETILEITRKKDGQTAAADRAEYIIGKNPKQADWFLADNPAISRAHACIRWKNNMYTVCDLGSSNGTYLRGKRLPKEIPAKLNDGDLLILADEEFSIHIYYSKQCQEE